MNDLKKFEDEVNSLFRVDALTSDKSNSYRKWWLEIMRDYPIAIARLRLREEKANLFASEIMRKAMRFQVSEAVLSLAIKLLRYHTFEGNLKQTESYEATVTKYRKIVNAEMLAEYHLSLINKELIKKVYSEKILEKVNQALTELEEYAEEVQSYSFQLYYYDIQFKKYQLEENHDMVLKVCQEALEKFGNKRFKVPDAVWFNFTYPSIPIYIKKLELEKAERALENTYKFTRKKTNNWFACHTFDVILNFYKGNFENVNVLLKQVTNYPTSIVRERYELFNAYAAIFDDRKIKVSRFANEVYEFSKDKEGYNIAILIAELIHLLKNKSYDKFIDRIEAIDKYISRTVNSRRVYRSKYFLKILLLAPSSNFHSFLFETKAKKNLEKIKELPISQFTPSVEVELIPYEILYEKVKSFLKKYKETNALS